MNRAARALGESQPTVARRLNRLEKALGVALLQRGVNSVSLTSAGRAALQACGPMAEAAGDVEAAAQLHRRRPDAPVRLTATTSVALFLSQHLPELCAAAAPRDILLLPSRRIFDIAGGEADLAVRMRAPPNGDGLLVSRLGLFVFAVYGLARAADAPLLTPPDGGPTSRQFAVAQRILARGRPAGPEIDEMHLRIQAVKSGVGVGSLPCFIGDADPDLARLYDGEAFEVRDDLYLVRAAASRGDAGVEATAKALTRLFRSHRDRLAGAAAEKADG